MICGAVLPERAVARLAKHLGRDAESLTVRDALTLRGADLTRATGMKATEAHRARLQALGVVFSAPAEDAAAKTSRKPKAS